MSDAWPDGMNEDDRAERCVCGASTILADTEDWRSCLCLACWLSLGSPEFEPRAPLRQILELCTALPNAAEYAARRAMPRRARLSCGHWVGLPWQRCRSASTNAEQLGALGGGSHGPLVAAADESAHEREPRIDGAGGRAWPCWRCK